MTYSHNSVSKNLKMTTAATAAATASTRNKNGAGEAGKSSVGIGSTSPPSTPPLYAHSNSIVSSNSTNDHYQPMLSSSPLSNNMSSAMSTSSNSSSSSSVSSLVLNSNESNSSGYFSSIRKQQRQLQQQRRSPQQQNSDCGCYFNNNLSHQQSSSGGKRNNGTGAMTQKNRDIGQRSPQSQHQSTRLSPASILGGGLSISPIVAGCGGNNSTRKARSKHSSPLLCIGGGKISPTYPLIPTALTHFAGSKCFDAPAPTALPKPPEHWTGTKSPEKAASSAGPGLQSVLNLAGARSHHIHHHYGHAHGGHVVKSSKRNLLDDFDTHNLKLLLNVQS